jgi:hypothetical protein
MQPVALQSIHAIDPFLVLDYMQAVVQINMRLIGFYEPNKRKYKEQK